MKRLLKIEFLVQGKPPKKDGANSMWNMADEVPRLIVLRQSALSARQRAGLTRVLETFVRLKVDILVPRHHVESVGDLDNFLPEFVMDFRLPIHGHCCILSLKGRN